MCLSIERDGASRAIGVNRVVTEPFGLSLVQGVALLGLLGVDIFPQVVSLLK